MKIAQILQIFCSFRRRASCDGAGSLEEWRGCEGAMGNPALSRRDKSWLFAFIFGRSGEDGAFKVAGVAA